MDKFITAGMLNAANRGVRVRFLVDDIYPTVTDKHLALLDAHAKIEVRLYNPVARRGLSVLNFLVEHREPYAGSWLRLKAFLSRTAPQNQL